MADKKVPAGPILDELGVTLDLDDEDRLTEVLLIAKITNLNTGRPALLLASNDLDWIQQWGLHAAAGQVYMTSQPVHGDDEDD